MTSRGIGGRVHGAADADGWVKVVSRRAMRKDGGASVQAKPRDVTVCDRVAPSNGGFAWKTVGGKGRRKQRRGRQNDRYCKPTAGRCGGSTAHTAGALAGLHSVQTESLRSYIGIVQTRGCLPTRPQSQTCADATLPAPQSASRWPRLMAGLVPLVPSPLLLPLPENPPVRCLVPPDLWLHNVMQVAHVRTLALALALALAPVLVMAGTFKPPASPMVPVAVVMSL